MNGRRFTAAALSIGAAAVLLSAQVAPRVGAVADWNYRVRVTGIAVTDSSGRAMAAPFIGGFDVPRPQLADIDGDGTVDLFVQERSGEVMLYERVGGEWVWRTDRFQDIDVGEWYRFADIDRDGDLDLFSEMRTGYIRTWQNTGSRTVPKFEALGDTIRDVDGRAIVADRQNILNAVDIDCNGKLDLFIGQVQGTVDRYEQEGVSPDRSPRFRLIEQTWQGIEVLGPEATGGDLRRTDTAGVDTSHYEGSAPGAATRPAERRHGANTLTFADITGRGVLDLFWGDFFEEGLLRFENTGTCAAPDLTGTPTRFPLVKPLLTSGYNAPTFGDADGDGLVDLIVGVIGGAYEPSRTNVNNLYLVQQRPKAMWSLATTRLINTIDVGAESAPALADVNGDGLLDLLVGSKVSATSGISGTVTLFENTGTRTAPAFRERGVLPVRGDYNYVPSVADLDGDGLVDLVVGTWRDRVQWYRNTGTRTAPAWTLADTALVTITRGTNSTPSLGDIDGDGTLDLVIGEASGAINLYRNTGTKSAPRFELVSDSFQGIKLSRRSAPVLSDMDGDGKLDMVVGSGEGELQLWRNTTGEIGSTISFVRDTTFRVQSYKDAIPATGDLFGTGVIDIVVGTSAGGLRWFSRATASSPR
ncbi:MAG: VCBS repeat-containing protein [Gemmatimonadota bacterium]